MKRAAILLCVCMVAGAQLSSASGPRRDHGGGGRAVVVWGSEGITQRVERALDRIDGVHATSVRLGLDWLLGSRASGGKAVDDPPAGFGYPLEVAVVRPNEYRRFVDPADAVTIASLGRGEILLSESEVKLRGNDRISRMRMRGRTVNVAGVISDQSAQGHEGLIAPPVPRAWPGSIRTVLAQVPNSVSRAELSRAVRKAMDGQAFRIKSDSATPYLRYAVSVPPIISFKKAFGEFAARPDDEGAITLAGHWVDRHITTRSVPILGAVRCHRELFRQLDGALRELKRKGKAHTVRRDDYAGCFTSRFVAASPGIRISRHTWGVAVDLNASTNRYGARPTQSPALVKTMRRWGFLWGGYWMTPDGMHFEWKRWVKR